MLTNEEDGPSILAGEEDRPGIHTRILTDEDDGPGVLDNKMDGSMLVVVCMHSL